MGMPIPDLSNLPGPSRPGGGGGAFEYTAIDNSFSMEFDGNSYYKIDPKVEFGANNSGDTNTYTSFSGCCWLKPVTGSSYIQETPFSFGINVSNTGVSIARGYSAPVGQGTKIRIRASSPSFFEKAGATTLDDGNWHHIAWTMTYDPSTVQFTIAVYVDGQPENQYGTTTPLTGVYGGDPAYKYGNLSGIGIQGYYDGNVGSYNYNGKIDEAAVWTTQVLSPETIQAIYDTTANNPGKVADLSETPEGAPAAWYRMGD